MRIHTSLSSVHIGVFRVLQGGGRGVYVQVFCFSTDNIFYGSVFNTFTIMRIFKVHKETNLVDFTDSNYPQGSFCLSTLLSNKDIKVNGIRVGKNVPLSRGDEVIYYTNAKQERLRSNEIRYEDWDFLLVDKYSGVSSEALTVELCYGGKVYPVHRLDRNTAGLMVYAKSKKAEAALKAAFKAGKVKKTYIALCKNAFTQKSETIKAYLKKDADNSLVKIYRSPTKGAERILTSYTVEQDRGDIALVKIELHTGKTHQIRAQMAEIGCPVLGDTKYGDSELNKKYNAQRQRLISKVLSFELDGEFAYMNDQVFESFFAFSE